LLAGLGLAIQPEFTVWEDLAAGRLEQVLTEWSLPLIALHMVTPPGGTDVGEMIPLEGIIFTRLASSAPVEEYNAGALTGPTSFGSGNGAVADSGSGDLAGVGFGWAFVVPSDYVSGNTLSNTSTYDNQTFSSLGVTSGTYEWTRGRWGEPELHRHRSGACAIDRLWSPGASSRRGPIVWWQVVGRNQETQAPIRLTPVNPIAIN